ncbi:MAG: ABC transporter permease [Chlorobia bacterium]|nr:ABC transporter permease [Fimbriimonadaceae bacterium]
MNPIAWVYRKEVREMLRDKRTRGAALFGPIFLMVFFICGFGTIIGGIAKKENQKIHFVKSDNPILASLKKEKMTFIELNTVAEGEKLVKDGKATVVLNFGPVPSKTGGQQTIEAYFDPKSQKAQIVLGGLEKVFGQANKTALIATLKKNRLPESIAEQIKLERKEVKIGEAGAGEFIVGMLPYLIVIWAFYGGFALATDLVAGEKEKITLETLLITPVSRTQIVMGKFLALSTLCLVSALASIFGLILVAVLKLPGSDFMLQGGLGISPTAGLITIIVLLPTVAMFASLLLAFSTYAKNSREAQSYISLASFVVVIPAAFSQLIGLTDAASQGWVNYVPVLNTANNIRNALLGKPDWTGTAITVIVSGAIATVLIGIVVRLFNREEVLTRV